ncbi:ParB/RepB/Spo0J family partition protein [Methylocystis parvus]|uniref:ParB/RepB/Spo0J family partition protein n=1 Tax=Methylocystis parvus TaxID=134 RepID=A0A6B8M7J2_9HYPH|nr:ParB/RepB/Spo0J family partition protein [Methylocystis parvus]QGN00055.1 ParB/RepB/Spo0J family partition protein [Methylocystis parvus]WBK02446.1 ParB/RepB/Spo0J family partition protein [Methylocystis parvus OBBP]
MSYARKLDDVAQLLDDLEGLEAPVSSGKPLEVPLSSIEEDRDQPRRAFDQKTLVELAASIRERGVLQPIGVTPADAQGRRRIVFGARRFRAAQLAGHATIPAFVHSEGASDPYDQMIENIQRDDLSAADIAVFISSRLVAGEKQKEIALRLGKDKSYIAMYASVAQMSPALRDRLATSPIRAVYELHQMWKKFPQAVESFCAAHDSFTRAQAVTFCEGLSGRPLQIVDASQREAAIGATADDAISPSVVGRNADGVPRADEGRPVGLLHPSESGREAPPRGPASSAPRKAAPREGGVTLRVEHRERLGQLILDRRSRQGETHGLVFFEESGMIEELPLAALKLVALKPDVSLA